MTRPLSAEIAFCAQIALFCAGIVLLFDGDWLPGLLCALMWLFSTWEHEAITNALVQNVKDHERISVEVPEAAPALRRFNELMAMKMSEWSPELYEHVCNACDRYHMSGYDVIATAVREWVEQDQKNSETRPQLFDRATHQRMIQRFGQCYGCDTTNPDGTVEHRCGFPPTKRYL